MTTTPMPPERERIIRIWHEELHRLTDRTAVARREALGDLLAEVDRLQAQVAELEADSSRLIRVEQVVEDARDKDIHTIDTDLLSDALGLDTEATP